MYIDENIKKMVEDAIKNMDPNGEFFKNVVSQITEQIKKEQEKISEPKVSHKLKDKADTYLKNNKSLDEYIANRDKFMGVFKKVAEKEITQEPSKNTWTQNTSQVSMMHNFSDGWYKWSQETTDGKIIGNIFFDLVRGNNNNFDTFLNIYSILNLYADEWENWEVEHYDWKIPNDPISKLVDSYTYEFTKEESKIIDSNEDCVYSYTHVEVDDELPMVSIYIMDYSKKTNKIYDFNRIIFTPSDDASENDIKLFYFDLYKYLNNPLTIETILEDFCYTFINKYIIHGVSDMTTVDKEYYNLIHALIASLLENKKRDGIKLTIEKEETPDKTNSILDKLGIPHDKDGNVEIPITDGNGMIPDKFISNRIGSINKTSDFLSDSLKKHFGHKEEPKEDIIDEEPDNPFDGYYYFIKGKDNQDIKQFLINAINDGFIKVDVFSPEHIHLNINGTNVFLKNPYASRSNRDIWGNKKH